MIHSMLLAFTVLRETWFEKCYITVTADLQATHPASGNRYGQFNDTETFQLRESIPSADSGQALYGAISSHISL